MKKRQFLKNGNAWRNWRRGNNAVPSASWCLPSDKRYGRRNINATSPGHKVHTFIKGVDILWLEMLVKWEMWYLFCNSCENGWFGEMYRISSFAQNQVVRKAVWTARSVWTVRVSCLRWRWISEELTVQQKGQPTSQRTSPRQSDPPERTHQPHCPISPPWKRTEPGMIAASWSLLHNLSFIQDTHNNEASRDISHTWHSFYLRRCLAAIAFSLFFKC